MDVESEKMMIIKCRRDEREKEGVWCSEYSD